MMLFSVKYIFKKKMALNGIYINLNKTVRKQAKDLTNPALFSFQQSNIKKQKCKQLNIFVNLLWSC